jgi:hypothetical protein
MNEVFLPASIWSDEAEAFQAVEEFDGANRQEKFRSAKWSS